jgi:hypothetical protein
MLYERLNALAIEYARALMAEVMKRPVGELVTLHETLALRQQRQLLERGVGVRLTAEPIMEQLIVPPERRQHVARKSVHAPAAQGLYDTHEEAESAVLRELPKKPKFLRGDKLKARTGMPRQELGSALASLMDRGAIVDRKLGRHRGYARA